MRRVSLLLDGEIKAKVGCRKRVACRNCLRYLKCGTGSKGSQTV